MSIWNNALSTSADWNTPANWSPSGVPNSTTAIATIANSYSQPQTINISQYFQVNSIKFNGSSSNAIIVGSSGSLNFTSANSSVKAALHVSNINSTTTINCAIQLNSDLVITVDAGCTLNIGGTIGGSYLLSFSGTGTVNFTSANSQINNCNIVQTSDLTLNVNTGCILDINANLSEASSTSPCSLTCNGQFIFNGTCIFSKVFTINGNVTMNHSNSIIPSSQVTITENSTLLYRGGDSNLSIALAGSGIFTNNTACNFTQSGNNIFTGTINNSGGGTFTCTDTSPNFNPTTAIGYSALIYDYSNAPINNLTINAAISINGSTCLKTIGIANVTLTGEVTSANSAMIIDGSLTLANNCTTSLAMTSSKILTINNGAIFAGQLQSMPAKIILNGTISMSELQIQSPCILSGSGSVIGQVDMYSGSTFSPELLNVGSLVLYNGSNFECKIINNSSTVRGVDYGAVNITGGGGMSNYGAALKISTLNTTIFNNNFWSNSELFNFIQNTGGGNINGNGFSSVNLYINGINQNSTNGPNGHFSIILNSLATQYNLQWTANARRGMMSSTYTAPTNASAGGDPHITTINGETYKLLNIEMCAEMYNNDELVINTEMKTLPFNFWKGEKYEDIVNSTYMHKTRISINNNVLIIDNHTLDILHNHGVLDYSFVDYDPDIYCCLGTDYIRGSFRAKLLSFKTTKLGEVQLAFVTVNDDTVVNDMCLFANPALLTVPALGAFVSENSVKWGANFSY